VPLNVPRQCAGGLIPPVAVLLQGGLVFAWGCAAERAVSALRNVLIRALGRGGSSC
jgi:hypothetical protein